VSVNTGVAFLRHLRSVCRNDRLHKLPSVHGPTCFQCRSPARGSGSFSSDYMRDVALGLTSFRRQLRHSCFHTISYNMPRAL